MPSTPTPRPWRRTCSRRAAGWGAPGRVGVGGGPSAALSVCAHAPSVADTSAVRLGFNTPDQSTCPTCLQTFLVRYTKKGRLDGEENLALPPITYDLVEVRGPGAGVSLFNCARPQCCGADWRGSLRALQAWRCTPPTLTTLIPNSSSSCSASRSAVTGARFAGRALHR